MHNEVILLADNHVLLLSQQNDLLRTTQCLIYYRSNGILLEINTSILESIKCQSLHIVILYIILSAYFHKLTYANIRGLN